MNSLVSIQFEEVVGDFGFGFGVDKDAASIVGEDAVGGNKGRCSIRNRHAVSSIFIDVISLDGETSGLRIHFRSGGLVHHVIRPRRFLIIIVVVICCTKGSTIREKHRSALLKLLLCSIERV